MISVIQNQNECYTRSVEGVAYLRLSTHLGGNFMKKKILIIFILYLIMSIFLYPLRESIWYQLFYTIAYLIAVKIYFALIKKKGVKK